VPVVEPRKKIVLCIGSDLVSLNLRCTLLKEQGWHAQSAGGGSQGIFSFTQEAVDVVVVDLNGDGTDTALITGELKRLRPEIPVIVLVARRETIIEGALQQADAVVLKSEETTELPEVLRRVLQGS
jgi:DNA-binding response OmpR family regulator